MSTSAALASDWLVAVLLPGWDTGVSGWEVDAILSTWFLSTWFLSLIPCPSRSPFRFDPHVRVTRVHSHFALPRVAGSSLAWKLSTYYSWNYSYSQRDLLFPKLFGNNRRRTSSRIPIPYLTQRGYELAMTALPIQPPPVCVALLKRRLRRGCCTVCCTVCWSL